VSDGDVITIKQKMKQILTLILFAFTFANLSAQTLTEKTTENLKLVSENIKGMVPDTISIDINNPYYQDIKQWLSAMSTSLGVATNKVFDVVVKQQLVKSIAILFSLLSMYFAVYKILKYIRGNIDPNNSDSKISNTIASVFIIAGAIGLSAMEFTTMLTGFINPEFGAYMDIVKFIQQIR